MATGPSMSPIAKSERPLVTSISGVRRTKSSGATTCRAMVALSLDIIGDGQLPGAGMAAAYSGGQTTLGFHIAKRPAGFCFHAHACSE